MAYTASQVDAGLADIAATISQEEAKFTSLLAGVADVIAAYNALSAKYADMVTFVQTTAAANAGNAAWQTYNARMQLFVAEFTAALNKATAVQTAGA